MNWNSAQLEAITERNSNLLVSAAAGSGKTAVLIERIKRLVIEDMIPVDRFLIVTFTKAAASEMREKLVNALSKAIAFEKDRDRVVFLKEQLDIIGSANISTFHSFALDVIRRYFYLTDLEPDFKICDEAQAALLKGKAIDMTFFEAFEKEDSEFINFISAYSSDRNENKAKNIVLEVYRNIQSIADPFLWLEENIKALECDADDFENSTAFKYIREDSKKAVSLYRESVEKISDILEEAGVMSLCEKYRAYYELISDADISQLSYDETGELISSLTMPQLRPKKEEKDDFEEIKEEIAFIKNRCKKALDSIKEAYYQYSLAEYVGDIKRTAAYGRELERIVRRFNDIYTKLKAEKKVIDFNDIEHYALDILKNRQVADEYRNKFRYIFIDEYQDSNDVQDTLVSEIKRDDNLFMVGDVKQSIYKFRLAEPELFMEKYRNYSTDEKSRKIDLNQNFRSKGSVISAINGIFEDIMEDYGPENALNKGIDYEENVPLKTDIIVIDDNREEYENTDEEILAMEKAQREAYVISDIIKKALGKNIYDVKRGEMRPVEKKDIVILMRSTKNRASVCAKVLEEENIPVYIDDSEGYFNTLEISLVESILKIIDNSRQDIPLIAVLYSPVFGFTVDELSDIRIWGKKEKYFHKIFELYAQEGDNEVLKEKCQEALSEIKRWKRIARDMSLDELVWKLIWDTGYYIYAGALPAGEQRQANLRALADKAKAAVENGIYDVYSFLNYIEAVKEKKVDIGQIKTIGEDEDVVRIMTVHKSKGLEFPVVICASLGTAFNFRQNESSLSIHKKYGIGLTYVNRKDRWKRKTLLQSVITRAMKQESYEEEKRILYVQLTRAMDRLIMVGTVRDYEKNLLKYSYTSSDGAKTPLELILPVAQEKQNVFSVRVVSLPDISTAASQKEVNRNSIRELFSEEGMTYDNVEELMSFRYADDEATRIKYKYSVTELNSTAENDEISVHKPAFSEVKQVTGALKGTLAHMVLEYADFRNPDIPSTIDMLCEKNLISEEEKGYIDKENIEAFFRSSIGRRAQAASFIRKEQPFSLLKEMNGTEIMVQGIIDCYFEENDQYVLVDYKNSSVKDDELLKERYGRQLEIYAEAIEKITGKKVKEKYLYLIAEEKELKMD